MNGQLLIGDVRERIKEGPDESVHSIDLNFIIPGAPQAKQRPRTVTRDSKGRRLAKALTYTPSETGNYERYVQICAFNAMSRQPPTDLPLKLTLRFEMPIPTSWSKRRQAMAARGEIAHTKKPDLDNLEKSIKDACNKIVWRDDSQVSEVVKDKIYSETPRVIVSVKSTGQLPAPR